MKKILPILTIFFIIPIVVFARPADPSLFPDNPPLRPPALNVQPNLEGNVSSDLGKAVTEPLVPQNDGSGGDDGAGSDRAKNRQLSNPGLTSKSAGAKIWFWGLGGLVLLAVLGYSIRRITSDKNG